MAAVPSGFVPQPMVTGTDEYGLTDLGRLSGQNLYHQTQTLRTLDSQRLFDFFGTIR